MLKDLKNSWRKLDNTAKIFSLDENDNKSVFRYSVILYDDIDSKLLKQALAKTLDNYSAFRVKIGTGLFWNYLEYNSKEPFVKEEKERFISINFKENNDYLFKLTYYKNTIFLTFFHVLTDGTGAIKFLKSILYNYLALKNNFKVSLKDNEVGNEDQYLMSYNKTISPKFNFKRAFLIPKKAKKKTNNTSYFILKISEVKKICKEFDVTVSEYLTALYIYAIYKVFYNRKSKREIIISVPINLRNYYLVDTLSNFFVCMSINPKILEKNLNSFKDILFEVHREFHDKLNKSMIDKYLTRDVKLGSNISIRLIPLVIKKAFMKYVSTLVNKASTSTMSNVGIIDIDEKYKKYIKNVLVMVSPSRVQKIKCTICSFKNNLNVTINSNIDEDIFEQEFFNILKTLLKKIEVKNN